MNVALRRSQSNAKMTCSLRSRTRIYHAQVVRDFSSYLVITVGGRLVAKLSESRDSKV